MKKRVLSILLVAALLASLCFTSAFAAAYDDTDGHWGEEAIAHWSDYSVVQGDDTGSFNPDDCMTRAEAATVFVNLLQLSTTGDISAFTDVDADAWYADAVAKCCAAGIIKGTSATTAAPYDLITREQFMTMFARAVGMPSADALEREFTDAADVSDWASGFVNALVNAGYVNGVSDTELAPLANITRASVMQVLYNSITTYANEANTEVEAAETGITLVVADNVNVTGSAEMISVAGENNTATATAASIATVPGNNSNLIFTVTESDAALDVAAVDGSNSSIVFDVNDGASVTIAAVSVTGENSGVIGSTSDEDTSVAVSGTAEDVTVSASGSHKLAVTVSDATVGITSGNVSVDGTADAVATSGSDVTVTTGGATITVSTASGSTVTVEKTATVGTVDAGSSETKVVVNGTADEVLVTGDSANVTVSTSADVGTIEVTEGTTGATVTTTQTVTDNGTNTTVSGSTSSSGGGGGGSSSGGSSSGGESHTHEYTLVEAKDATCTEAGNTAYWTCSCGTYWALAYDESGAATQGEEITLASTVIEALGGYHVYDSATNTCSVCGETCAYTMENVSLYNSTVAEVFVLYDDGYITLDLGEQDGAIKSGSSNFNNGNFIINLLSDMVLEAIDKDEDGNPIYDLECSSIEFSAEGSSETLEITTVAIDEDDDSIVYFKADSVAEVKLAIQVFGVKTETDNATVFISADSYILDEVGYKLTFKEDVEFTSGMSVDDLLEKLEFEETGKESDEITICIVAPFSLPADVDGYSQIELEDYIESVTIVINGASLGGSAWGYVIANYTIE